MQQPGGFVPVQQYPAPGLPGPTAKDESDLDLLSTLHYVWSGLLGCGTLGMMGYFVMVTGVLGIGASQGGGGGEAVAAIGVMAVIGVAVCAMMLALFAVHFLAASGLRKRKRRVLTYVASALMCTSFPLGTLLGVFTIMTLGRPGVKALYKD
jgi:hypothetical protein